MTREGGRKTVLSVDTTPGCAPVSESSDVVATRSRPVDPGEVLVTVTVETRESYLGLTRRTHGRTTDDVVCTLLRDLLVGVRVNVADESGDGHPEDRCHRCGGPNVTWSAPSPLWNAVMRGGSINGEERCDGIVCPTCFAVLAEESGVATAWRLYATDVAVPLETVTPSGRVWDPDTWLWVFT